MTRNEKIKVLGVRHDDAVRLLDSEGVRLFCRYLATVASDRAGAVLGADLSSDKGVLSAAQAQAENRLLLRLASRGVEDLLALLPVEGAGRDADD